MKTYIFLQGGLGNQMFQYAFYLMIKQINPKTICDFSLIKNGLDYNGFELEKVFNLREHTSKASYFLAKICSYLSFHKRQKLLSNIGITLVEDSAPSTYMPQIIDLCLKPFTVYLGYWQTEKYFKQHTDIIKQAFSFNLNLLSLQTKECAMEIQKKNSISIHIRRGDYLHPKFNHLYGNICTIEYYKEAITILQQKYANLHFYIFSDDISWVKENLPIVPSTYIDWNKKEDSWQDMYLMSQCKHNIIANSSFSWWGAWLNNNPNKTVICPSRFMNLNQQSDIVPEDWIQIQIP